VAVDVVIEQDVTTMALTAAPNPALVNQPITLTATVYGDPPSGTVTFYDGATVLGTGALSEASPASSAATLTVRSLAAGRHALSARYEGDHNNQASSTAAVVLLEVRLPASAPTAVPALDDRTLLVLALLLGGMAYRARRKARRLA
jgi:hypothetical protein